MNTKENEYELLQALENTYGKLKIQYIDDGISYIGFNIERNKNTGDIYMSMPKYIENLIKENNIQKTAVTPATKELYEPVKDDIPCDRRLFLSVLMSTYYIANRLRYEILHTLSTLATRSKNPTTRDMKCLIRVLQYLKLTKHYKLVYKHQNVIEFIHEAYIDASHSLHLDGKGHTGVIFLLKNIGVLCCKSWKHKLVATSTTHSELLSLYEGLVRTVLWLSKLIAEITNTTNRPITIYQDNASAKYVVENTHIKSNRLKHINVKYNYIQELNELKEIKVIKIGTENMLADGLTKVIIGKSFRKFVKFLYNMK